MLVYLIRHEEAEDGGYDAHRALTGNGRRRIRKTAALLAKEAPIIDRIHTSPLVRAVQTAEIVADRAGLDEPLLVSPEIANPPSLQALVDLIDGAPIATQGLVIVGHEPTLGALVSRLLNRPRTGLSKGEVYALIYDRSQKSFELSFRIDPDGPTRVDQ
jgi:phosphohistidine phosphatase